MASVDVNCVCGKPFTAEPTAESGFIVKCPSCGTLLRVKPPGVSRKEFRKALAPAALTAEERIARRVKRSELVSGILWLVIGSIQLVLLWAAAAGVWNIINAIIRLRSVKNIQAGNPNVVLWYDGRRNWLIAFAAVNLVLGGVVGILLVAFDWWVRDFVLKNKAVFEGPPACSA